MSATPSATPASGRDGAVLHRGVAERDEPARDLGLRGAARGLVGAAARGEHRHAIGERGPGEREERAGGGTAEGSADHAPPCYARREPGAAPGRRASMRVTLPTTAGGALPTTAGGALPTTAGAVARPAHRALPISR
ncbi:hypothetical protein WMF31_38505 [Sorangium sp. So ce1036]|uniref:hypothetical protein n=1 Tax=Sorangium sp. So ce1036 TaxID=3133328 RepID=UPI003EFDAD20